MNANRNAEIRSVDVVIADIPTIRPHVLAMTTMMAQTMVLIFVMREDGITGVGEATTIGGLAYGEESPESIKVNVETYFAPLLIGQNGDDCAAIMARLDAHIVGNRFAKCAIETALLDAKGQASGQPISAFFGGAKHETLPVAWTLASGHTEQDIEEGERVIDARLHRDFKLKIGKRDVVADCGHVAKIARVFEGRASIRVDVNQHWSLEEAREGAARLQHAGVDLIEQPLAGHDINGMKQLSDDFTIAIMADEGLTGPISAQRFADAQAADVFALKIAQSGGLTKAREVALLGARASIDMYGGTMLEGPVGTVASAHLFATIDHLKWGTELFGPLLMTEEFLQQPLDYRDFMMKVPTGPGLGIVVDREKLAQFERS